MEKQENKKIATLEYGSGGHESEYLLILRKDMWSMADKIPWELRLESRLKETLGKGFNVENRGHRVEIMPPGLKKTDEINAQVVQAVKDILGDDYDLIEVQGNEVIEH